MNAPNEAARRHLRVRVTGSQSIHTACGLDDPRQYTSNPGQVTCGACRRTVAMADAEIIYARRNKNRRRSGN